MNSTDYLPRASASTTFPCWPRIARQALTPLRSAGGMWDCLVRPERELGLSPVPAPNPYHIQARRSRATSCTMWSRSICLCDHPGRGQSRYRTLEVIVRQAKVQFISLCRPIISEPGLARALAGRQGQQRSRLHLCNSCLYDMYTRLERGEPAVATCWSTMIPSGQAAQQCFLHGRRNAVLEGDNPLTTRH